LVTWQVIYHPEAEAELKRLPAEEQVAIRHAVIKLQVHGPVLGHPHSSAVRSAASLRELRPRGGRSPWRAFYRQVGAVFVIGAVGPEADVHPRKFRRAVAAAQRRLDAAQE
jgi:hypothetical protein